MGILVNENVSICSLAVGLIWEDFQGYYPICVPNRHPLLTVLSATRDSLAAQTADP